MPIYEYECRECEADFEELVRSADAADRVNCPKCGSKKVGRRLSVFAARDAGGGSGASMPMGGGGCGRCGDPNGPCGTR